MVTKFSEPEVTAKGEQRASVSLSKLKTLWFNTGTRCNITCENCYIESSPYNDRLAYLTVDDVRPFLEEIVDGEMGTEQISFTGGEPFINPDIIKILECTLGMGFNALVLTNAHKVLKKHHDALSDLQNKYGSKFKLRISLDHYTEEVHDQERGTGTFQSSLTELKWLYDNGFHISIAGRSLLDESIDDAITGYQSLMDDSGIEIKLKGDNRIVVFPEMHRMPEVPEITTGCWKILDKSPKDIMCSTERMIVKRKDAERPVVLSCTLLAYDEQFELGETLADAKKKVFLNHHWCAEFCVLGGASCSSTG